MSVEDEPELNIPEDNLYAPGLIARATDMTWKWWPEGPEWLLNTITRLTERLTLAQRQWTTVLIWTIAEIIILRGLPLAMGYPAMLYVIFQSVTQGCGILITTYFMWDLVRWAKHRNAPSWNMSPALMQAQAVISRKESLINEGMSLPGLMLVCIVGLGIIIPQLMDNTAYQLVIAILIIFLIASVFTMVGRNSTGTIVVVLLALAIVAIFFKGADVMWRAIDKWLQEERQRVPNPIRVEEVVGGPIHDLVFLARGLLSMPWSTPLGYSYNSLPALLNTLIGGFMVSLIVIDDQLGPAVCIAEAAKLTNNVKDPTHCSRGWSPVFSRWVTTWILNAALSLWYMAFNPFPFLMKVAGAYTAYLAFEHVTSNNWRSAGQFLATMKGRVDMEVVAGHGPLRSRKNMVQIAGLVSLAAWSTMIGPIMPGVVAFLLILIQDHRVLCGLMTILTLDIGWLAGVTHPRSLTRDAEQTQLPANAQADVGTNSFSQYRVGRRSKSPAKVTMSINTDEAGPQIAEKESHTRDMSVQTEELLHKHTSDPPVSSRTRSRKNRK